MTWTCGRAYTTGAGVGQRFHGAVMADKHLPLSPFEMLGITLASQVVMVIGLFGRVIVDLIGQLGVSIEAPAIVAVSNLMGATLFGLICFCLVKGHFVMIPKILKNEGRFDAETCTPAQLVLGGLKWGLFCCALPLLTIKGKPAK